MPELPEVETVRRSLAPRLPGAVLVRFDLRLPRMLEVGTPRLLGALAGSRFAPPRRHGKYLLLDLEREPAARDHTLVVHLGMTGTLTWSPPGAPAVDRFQRTVTGYQRALGPHSIDRHTHAVLDLEGGARLVFRDPRTFGRLLVLPTRDLPTTPRLARLGPDAWGLPPEAFLSRWEARAGRRAVKAALLDQSLCAGIGNIYADEACFRAGIRPGSRTDRVSRPRLLRLADAVQAALAQGIENCGTSFRDFVDGDGSAGSNQEDLRVYGRGGEACLACGRTLASAAIAQRTTVWCPGCQR